MNNCVAELIQLDVDKALPIIKEALADDNATTRKHVIYTLGSIGNSRFIPLIKKHLVDQDTKVRSTSVRCLGKICGNDELHTFKKLLNSDNNADALEELFRIDKEGTISILEEILNRKCKGSPCHSLHILAITLLKEVDRQISQPLLEKAFKTYRDWYTRYHILGVLDDVAGHNAIKTFKTASKCKNKHVRNKAIEIMKKYK